MDNLEWQGVELIANLSQKYHANALPKERQFRKVKVSPKIVTIGIDICNQINSFIRANENSG